jgi:predicted SAM-dependent methyltransferase
MPSFRRGWKILKNEGAKTFAYRVYNYIIGRSISRVIETVQYYYLSAGSGRDCPICGFSGRQFSSTPMGDIQCPNCRSLPRQRILWMYLQNETDVLTNKNRVLEFSPRYGLKKEFSIRDNIQYTSVDISSSDVDVHVDISNLPFVSGSFDVIVCSHVLEHVRDDQSAIDELHRVLNENGELFVMVPKDKGRSQTYENPNATTREERLQHFGHPNHERIYGRDFPDRLSQSGFHVNVITYPAVLDTDVVETRGLRLFEKDMEHYRTEVEFDDIHVCVKD